MFWRPPRGERTTRDLRALGERRRFAPPEVDIPASSPSDRTAAGQEDPLLRVERVEALSYSARRVSRTKDFATFTDAEIAQARAAIASLDWELGTRISQVAQGAVGATLETLNELLI